MKLGECLHFDGIASGCKMLPKYCQNVAKILSKGYQKCRNVKVVKMLSKFCQCVKCCQNIVEMSKRLSDVKI